MSIIKRSELNGCNLVLRLYKLDSSRLVQNLVINHYKMHYWHTSSHFISFTIEDVLREGWRRLTFIIKENRFLNILSLLNYFFIVFQYLNRLSRNNKLLVKFMICLLLFRKYIPPWPLKSGQKYIIYFFDFKIHLLVLHFYPLLQMPILLKNIKKAFFLVQDE